MTDPISTPAQMRKAAALLPCPFCGGKAQRITISESEPDNAGGDVICCDRCQASSHVEFGRKENLVDAWNRRALPVAAPLCTWPSCGHTAKGQCNPTFAPPVAEQQAIRDQALNDAAQAASNRAAYFRDAAETASEAGFHALRAFHAMRELCLVEIAAAIRAMKGKPE